MSLKPRYGCSRTMGMATCSNYPFGTSMARSRFYSPTCSARHRCTARSHCMSARRSCPPGWLGGGRRCPWTVPVLALAETGRRRLLGAWLFGLVVPVEIVCGSCRLAGMAPDEQRLASPWAESLLAPVAPAQLGTWQRPPVSGVNRSVICAAIPGSHGFQLRAVASREKPSTWMRLAYCCRCCRAIQKRWHERPMSHQPVGSESRLPAACSVRERLTDGQEGRRCSDAGPQGLSSAPRETHSAPSLVAASDRSPSCASAATLMVPRAEAEPGPTPTESTGPGLAGRHSA